MRTKEIEQTGADANLTPGMTSYTGNSILHRTQKNTPENESQIRGMTISTDEFVLFHRILGPRLDRVIEAGLVVVV